MTLLNRTKVILAAIGLSTLVVSGVFVIAAQAQPRGEMKSLETASLRTIPFTLAHSIPLQVRSPAEWNGKIFHLVKLGSMQFEFDKQTGRLKADIRAGVMTFDDVDYDISAAVFDASGWLLGATRAQCKVERLWIGRVVTSERAIRLDFGVSRLRTRQQLHDQRQQKTSVNPG